MTSGLGEEEHGCCQRGGLGWLSLPGGLGGLEGAIRLCGGRGAPRGCWRLS